MDLSLVPYQHQQEDNIIKYKECMRNHAASIGGHANDGCGEFMPRSEDNSLTCAACGCHRNFHRREVPGQHPKALVLFNSPINVHHKVSHQVMGAALDSRYDDYDRRSETPEREDVRNLNVGHPGNAVRVAGAGAATAKSKRHRTKFTQEQKGKMLEFAERIGWRMQRHDDVDLNQFCNEVGVKRNALKVWMHNNKNAHRRREESTSPSPVDAPRQAQPAGV